MTEKFLALPQEKQERIINAATKEFATKGFKNASTNEIVKEAGISKGLLFHYFNNKKDLFLFLYDHFSQILMTEFFDKLDLEETDIFKKLKEITIYKLHLMNQYPEMFNFFIKAQVEEDAEIKQEIENRNNELTVSSFAKLFSNIDTTKFKEGLAVDKVINIIIWTFEGMREQNMKKLKLLASKGSNDYQELFDDVEAYIDVLKNTFYK